MSGASGGGVGSGLAAKMHGGVMLTRDCAKSILEIIAENEHRFGEKDHTTKRAMKTILALYDENERLKTEVQIQSAFLAEAAKNADKIAAWRKKKAALKEGGQDADER